MKMIRVKNCNFKRNDNFNDSNCKKNCQIIISLTRIYQEKVQATITCSVFKYFIIFFFSKNTILKKSNKYSSISDLDKKLN